MGLFFKKTLVVENRIENAGRWPVRLTHFHLVDEYEFPATNFPEIFFAQQGSFLLESAFGTQAVREGAAIMVNPGNRLLVKQPEETALSRVRFLPEWLTLEYPLIVHSPQMLALFFDRSWILHPRDETLHVFTTRGEAAARVRDELAYLGGLLRQGRQLEPAARISLLKLMVLLADEHLRYWRGAVALEIPPEARHAFDRVESSIHRGEAFDLKTMPRGSFGKRAVVRAFEELAGMDIAAYAQRRRMFHAAVRLLLTREEPRRVSRELGFAATGEFSKQFEAVFSLAPGVYQRRFGPPPEEPPEPPAGDEGAGEEGA